MKIKNLFLGGLILMGTISSCFPKSRWAERQKEDFLRICKSNNASQYGDKIDDYCACMLSKLEAKSPNPLNLPDIPIDTMAMFKAVCGGNN